VATIETDECVNPILISIRESCRISGYSRSETYRRLAAGDIEAVKAKSRTLIVYASLLSHLRALPPAKFRRPARGKPSAGGGK
jgi:hypothetical protein